MTIKVTLNESDYLTHQLYTASKSKRVISSRRKTWLILAGMFFVTAFIAKGKIDFFAYYFFGAGIVTLLFYPFYQKYRYRKHFRKFIAENYQYRFGKESLIDFQPAYINCKDITGESTINTSEISQVIEINTHYFIKVKSGESLIIPKSLVSEKTFLTDLTQIFQNPHIVINKELDWHWK